MGNSLVLIDKLNKHYAETEQKPPVGVRIGISAGEGQSKKAIFSCPAATTCLITNYVVTMTRDNAATATCDVIPYVREDASSSTAPLFSTHRQGLFLGGDPLTHAFNPYFPVPAKSDYIMRAVGCTNDNTSVSAGFDVIIVDD